MSETEAAAQTAPTRAGHGPPGGDRSALAALGGLVVAFLGPALLGRPFFLKDAALWFYPSRLYLRQRLLAGELPLWNPTLDMGSPLLADPSQAALYPLNLICLLPAPGCVGQFLVAHVLLAVLGTYALLRLLRLRPWSAAFGAAAFGLGGYILSMTWSGTHLLSVAWMPLVAALTLRTARRRRLSDVALLALAAACQLLSGEPQGMAMTGMLTLALLAAEPGGKAERLRGALALGAAGVLGLGLTLPQVLPTLDLLAQSARAHGIALEEAQHWSFHPLRLAELLAPGLYGDPTRMAGPFLGGFLNSEGGETARAPWMITPYLGSLTMVAAALGVALRPQPHRRWMLAVAGVGGFGLLLALGRHTPVFELYFRAVPGASLFRYPAKYFTLTALCLPLLGAVGVEALRDRLAAGGRRVALGVSSGVAALVLALFGGAALALHLGAALVDAGAPVAGAEATSILRWSLVAGGASLALGSLAVALAARRRPGWVAPVALAALATQLGLSGRHITHTTEPELFTLRPALARAVVPDGSGRLPDPPRVWRHSAPREIAPDTPRLQVLAEELATLAMNTGILHGVAYADSYSATSVPVRAAFYRATARVQKPVLDLLSMAYLIVPADTPVDERLGMTRLGSFGGSRALLVRNDRALPMARPVAGVRTVGAPEEALAQLLEPAVLSGRVAVVEGLSSPEPEPSSARPRGACRTERPSDEQLTVRCELPAPAWIVINESHREGWRASLDEAPVPLLRANVLVMAAHLPAGRSELQLRYEEPRLGLGFLGGGLALLACLVLLALDPRRERRS